MEGMSFIKDGIKIIIEVVVLIVNDDGFLSFILSSDPVFEWVHHRTLYSKAIKLNHFCDLRPSYSILYSFP